MILSEIAAGSIIAKKDSLFLNHDFSSSVVIIQVCMVVSDTHEQTVPPLPDGNRQVQPASIHVHGLIFLFSFLVKKSIIGLSPLR
ncbi:TPA: hypothetical protein DCZ39_04830 [Patescibacteria group bacterium]|nr:hypothetical protein [Candidatus Gracilibacteria bacterium]